MLCFFVRISVDMYPSTVPNLFNNFSGFLLLTNSIPNNLFLDLSDKQVNSKSPIQDGLLIVFAI